MKYKKIMLILITAIFLVSIAGVCAADANDTMVASENTNQIELSDSDKVIEDNLQTSEENEALASTDYDEAIAQTDTEVLGADSAKYSDLAEEISQPGNIKLTHKNYTYDKGETITISEANKVIDGNGAVIDMNGSTIRAFYISASGVTIKNLTIKNATNYDGGGAIYFSKSATSGTVTNCNFTDNTAYRGGAVYFYNDGTVSNCNFADNTATNGGAVYFNREGTVTNCNFTNNTAKMGNAIYINNKCTISDCDFTNNPITKSAIHSVTGDITLSNNIINVDDVVSDKNFTEIQKLIDRANDGDEITINGLYAGFGIPIRITKSLTLNGQNNTTLDAKKLSKILYITANNVIIKNIQFTSGYAEYGGAIYFSSTGTVTNCNFTGNTASYGGGAVYFDSTGTVSNCNFINNTGKSGSGGAIYFDSTGTVTNCNFVNNTASQWGGAIYFEGSGTVTNCNFTDNSASLRGGAVYFLRTGNVSNCNFTGNNATTGSAIYFYKWYSSDTLTVSDSTFLNNRANAGALDIVKTENNITITFTGQNNLLNAIYSRNDEEVTFTNVTYWGADGITTVSSTMSGSNNAAGQKITVGVVVNNELVLSDVMVTDENGMIVLDINAGENYYISVHHGTDSYYTEAERTISNNTKFNVNVTSQTIHNKTVNITAKSNIPNDVVQGKLLFILPNGTQINANYAGNGTWWAVHTFDYGVYQVSASYYGLYDVTVKNATIAIKLKTELTSNAITTTYNINKNLVITLKDSTGKALSGVSVTVDLNGAKTYATDKNGQVKVSTKGLAPKAYTAKVTFNGNTKYAKSTKDIKVTVKKATPKMKAKKKTFKRTVKTKKYTIVLKDNTGKAMKKVKVTLKIKGKKTITVKTNNKGKATFKIKKLFKKGKYKATVTYKGNKNYNKVTKKVKIVIK